MKQQPVAVNDGSASTSLAELTDVLFITVFNRPGVAGAVLHTASSLIN